MMDRLDFPRHMNAYIHACSYRRVEIKDAALNLSDKNDLFGVQLHRNTITSTFVSDEVTVDHIITTMSYCISHQWALNLFSVW